MKINRMICIALIIGSAVFASFFGGNISYAFFYLALLIPLISILYTVYVYFRFKLYQSLENKLVVKGDWTEYSFIIANEDYITFRNIKVNFLCDKSTIESPELLTEYSLLPSESHRMETRIKCNYRGEYFVGVDSVEVTDFLYLFKITYPIGTKLNVTVLPKVVPLEQLGIAPAENDVKNPFQFSNQVEEELDTEFRKYYPGDSRKRIHWKASARMHELISRKYQHIPKSRIVVFMDLYKIKEEDLKVVIAEDKIMESVLAITNYYALRRIPSQIIYVLNGKQQVEISSKEAFNAFYKTCAKIYFHAEVPVSELIKERMHFGEEGLFCVVATHYLTKELYLAALNTISGGNKISILLISDDTTEETKKIKDTMRLSGIKVHQIMSEDEIGDVLTEVI